MFKRLIASVFIFLLISFTASFAYFDLGAPIGFVNDYTNTLSTEERSLLEGKLSNFEKQTSNEVFVVIFNTLDGDSIENFANTLFNKWGIGKADKDNGVLILTSLADRKMRIEVGYGLEGSLTDAQSSWIINQEMKPAFQNGNYFYGLILATDKIIAATTGEFVPSEAPGSNKLSGDLVGFSFWFGYIFLIIISALLGRSKSWWLGGIVGGVVGVVTGLFLGLTFGLWATIVLVPIGLIFDFIVSRAYTQKKSTGRYPWWFGGGGSGGFGGGGGFSGGGGGSSGGGGASGRW